MQTDKIESWIKGEAERLYDDYEYAAAIKREGFTAGANLLLPEIKLRDQRIGELENNNDWRGQLKSLMIGLNAREKEVKFLQSEVARLKGLIEKAHLIGWLDFPEDGAAKHQSIESSWNHFKAENNLELKT